MSFVSATPGNWSRRAGSNGFQAATGVDRILLTADQSDFADPTMDDHVGGIVVADVTRS